MHHSENQNEETFQIGIPYTSIQALKKDLSLMKRDSLYFKRDLVPIIFQKRPRIERGDLSNRPCIHQYSSTRKRLESDEKRQFIFQKRSISYNIPEETYNRKYSGVLYHHVDTLIIIKFKWEKRQFIFQKRPISYNIPEEIYKLKYSGVLNYHVDTLIIIKFI